MDVESRLRIGRAIAKTEEEAAYLVMKQLHRFLPQEPPAVATDGLGAYREAMLSTWGKVPPWCGRGRPPTRPQPEKTGKYLQIRKKRKGSRIVEILSKVVYGDPEEVRKI